MLLPFSPSPFHINGQVIRVVTEYTFIGVNFCSDRQRPSELHCMKKARTARSVANITFCLESHVGRITPKEGVKLYTARIDPHLTHAADVFPDATPAYLRHLEIVQQAYLRRLLQLGTRANTVLLFSETGLLPLRERRLDLALCFLRYCIQQPTAHLARAAMSAMASLAELPSPSGWYHDLRVGLSKLEPPVLLPAAALLQHPADVDAIIERVFTSLRTNVLSSIAKSHKLEFLHERKELNRDGKAITVALGLRPYLLVPNPIHRRSLTRYILSNHTLAVERLRWRDRRAYDIPRHLRRCRLCLSYPEDPPHVLLQCADPTLTSLRQSFITSLPRPLSTTLRQHIDVHSPQSTLQYLIMTLKAPGMNSLASYTHQVSTFIDKHPLYVPTASQCRTSLTGQSSEVVTQELPDDMDRELANREDQEEDDVEGYIQA